MNEPKIPTEHPSGNWQAVDIFLFSNGHHQTPPRKYHIRAEQLIAWNETLKTLAHLQYGNAHNVIDIYTIEGTKIISPLEISNGGAYVAVPLHHNFVPAGYNEYILKASRSREKRFGKFKKPITTTSPGRRGLIVAKNQPKDDPVYLKGIIEEIIDSITNPTGDRRESKQSQGSKLGTLLSKPFHKRNLNDPNSPTAKKRNFALPRSTLVKSSLKNKEALPRNNLKVNIDKPSNKTSTLKVNDSNLNSVSKELPKLINSNEMGKTDDETKKVELIEMPPAPTYRSECFNDKISVTEDNTFENLICDRELIVVKTADSEMTAVLPLDNSTSVCGNKFKISSILMTPIEECKYAEEEQDGIPVTVINNFVENIFSPEVAVSKDMHAPTKAIHITKTNESNVTYTPVINNIATENRLPADSFKAVVNKGDIVSLNLRIEVKQADGVGDSISGKLNHIHITEKSSQVNIGEIFVESLEKHTKVAPAEDKPKVVVIPCNCNKNSNYAPANLDETKYVLLLPTYEQQGEGCEEENKIENVKKMSVPNPIKKVYGDTFLLDLESVAQPVTIHTSTTNLNTSTSVTKVDSVVKNLKVISATENCIPKLTPSKQLREKSKESVGPVRSVPTKINSQITTKHLVDESTQTEWHTLLLEAKRHPDGRYSFHLPPLQVLKYYSL